MNAGSGLAGQSWPADFLTVDEAARCLDLSPQRVRLLLARGKLEGFRLRQGVRQVWCICPALQRRAGVAGRPRKRRRKAAAGDGGSEAKP